MSIRFYLRDNTEEQYIVIVSANRLIFDVTNWILLFILLGIASKKSATMDY